MTPGCQLYYVQTCIGSEWARGVSMPTPMPSSPEEAISVFPTLSAPFMGGGGGSQSPRSLYSFGKAPLEI